MLGLKLIHVSEKSHSSQVTDAPLDTKASAVHYNDVIMGGMASQITSLTIVYSTVYSGADQRKHQSSAWLAFVWGIHRWPVNSPHKGPVTWKMFPFDDVIKFGLDMYGANTWSFIKSLCPHNHIFLECARSMYFCIRIITISHSYITIFFS